MFVSVVTLVLHHLEQTIPRLSVLHRQDFDIGRRILFVQTWIQLSLTFPLRLSCYLIPECDFDPIHPLVSRQELVLLLSRSIYPRAQVAGASYFHKLDTSYFLQRSFGILNNTFLPLTCFINVVQFCPPLFIHCSKSF